MQRRVGAFLLISFLLAPVPLAAAELPAIKASRGNAVPDCVTPGRLMAYLASRNPSIDSRFDSVATEYMRIGEELGVRWDYAFYQMLLETGSLSFRNGNRAGDVRPAQNNFAGLGATGRGEHGESFKDVASGVRAHLEHLLLYAGDRIDSPVAERTRKVQEWGVLTDWQRGFTRPITFADLAAKWAPGTRSYRRMIEGIAERFEEFCSRPDPRPELVQEARGQKDRRAAETKTADAGRSLGVALAQRAIETGKSENADQRSALGAGSAATHSSPPSMPFRLLNGSPAEQGGESVPGRTAAPAAANTPGAERSRASADEKGAGATASGTPRSSDPPSGGDKVFQTASAATAAAKPPASSQSASPAQKCRVWTASYGGQKAMIIKSQTDKVINYTVLDVNEGAETREAEAFISAYAKNGAVAGRFNSQAQALEKAFELCPEG